MAQNTDPDAYCRRCLGTGRQVDRQDRQGTIILVSEPCDACQGTGSKVFIGRGVAK